MPAWCAVSMLKLRLAMRQRRGLRSQMVSVRPILHLGVQLVVRHADVGQAHGHGLAPL